MVYNHSYCIPSSLMALIMMMMMMMMMMMSAGASAALPSNFFNDIDGISISLSNTHACSIQSVMGLEFGGTAYCWGNNYYGQLVIPEKAVFVQIVTGLSFTCGILIDQTVRCWGKHIRLENVPGYFSQISAASYFACGVMTDGKLFCWGIYSQQYIFVFNALSFYHRRK